VGYAYTKPFAGKAALKLNCCDNNLSSLPILNPLQAKQH